MRISLISAVAGLVILVGCGKAPGQQGETPSPSTPAAAAPTAPVPTVKTAQRPITAFAHVERRGTGPIPMILIPTIMFDWTTWESFMDRNAERYTMYAVTLPGMCGTPPPILADDETWEQDVLLSNAVFAIDHLIDFAKLDRPVIVGHGLGGHLAMRYALAHREKTRAIVSVEGMPYMPLADPSQHPTFEERKEIIRRTTAPELMKIPDDEWKSRAFLNTLSMVTDEVRARDLAVMMNKTDRYIGIFYYLEMALSDYCEQLKQLQAPMLVIAAIGPDPTPPPSYVRSLWTQAIGAPPNTTLTFYQDTRHMVMDDNPAQLDHDVALFLAGQTIPGALRTHQLQESAAERAKINADRGPDAPPRP